MKIQKIDLTNYRGLTHAKIEFEPDLTVIAGVNGAGKSSILKALCIPISHAHRALADHRGRPMDFAPKDLRFKTSQTTGLTQILEGQQQLLFTNYRRLPTARELARARAELSKLSLRFKPTMSDDELLELEEQERFQESLLQGDRESRIDGIGEETESKWIQPRKDSRPIGVFYSPTRHLVSTFFSLTKQRAFDLTSAYDGALASIRLDQRTLVEWYRYNHMLGLKSPVRRKVLAELKKAITSFIPEITDIRLRQKPSVQLELMKGKTPLTINQLSDGEKGLVTILFDLTRRLALANKEMRSPSKEAEAIVLIDEIELHLHPEWQRTVTQKLRETFPKCQFIITTHSPQIVGEVEPRCVRLLKDGIVSIPPQSFGMDSNWILEHLMHVDKRNSRIDGMVDQIQSLIAKRQLEEAKDLIRQVRLETKNQEVLQRLSATIDRIKLMGK